MEAPPSFLKGVCRVLLTKYVNILLIYKRKMASLKIVQRFQKGREGSFYGTVWCPPLFFKDR